MPAVEVWRACPNCRALDHHFIEHRVAAGVTAHWPDPAAPHYHRECQWCRYQWDEADPEA